MGETQPDNSTQDYHYLNDAGGNVVKVLNADDLSVANEYEYGPFGQTIAKTETVDNPYQYNTKYHDEETGLLYYGFRFYDNEHGRWINRDPIGYAGGINFYNSVSNNMVNGFSGGLATSDGMESLVGFQGPWTWLDAYGLASGCWAGGQFPGSPFIPGGEQYKKPTKSINLVGIGIALVLNEWYPDEISRQMIYRYGEGLGKPFILKENDMLRVMSNVDVDADIKLMRDKLALESKGKTVKVKVEWSGPLRKSPVPGTLGRYYAKYKGEFTYCDKFNSKVGLLVIDELGYMPIDKAGCDLLFQVISGRYEKAATIITTNRAYKQWPVIFNNDAVVTSAILDRVLHHSETIRIEGKSYRMADRQI